MTHKYFILLLIPIAFGCGSNSSDNTQDYTEYEGFRIYDLGDINGDGIQDSVVLTRDVTDTSSTGEAGIQDDEDAPVFLFSLYLGKGNNQYEQIKHFVTPFLSTTEASISIPKIGRLVIDIEHFVYEYAFRNNELYLEKHEQLNEGEPYFCLDFTKNELRTELCIDSLFHPTIPIPEGRRPSISETNIEQSMSDTFFGKYLYYSQAFYDSLLTMYKKEVNTSKVSIIDNDTLLEMNAERGRNFFVILSFLKKGLSQNVINAIEQDFLNSDFRKLENRYNNYSEDSDVELSKDTSFEDVFYKNKKIWEKLNIEEGVEEYVTYRIKPIYENDHFVTCLFGYESLDCRYCYYTYYITYDKKTGKSFSWDMIRKDDKFRSLLMSYLSKKKDIEEGRFKYSNCPPFISHNGSLCIYYQRYEITDDCIEGCPEATIPFDEVEPFLTEEGKQFLHR